MLCTLDAMLPVIRCIPPQAELVYSLSISQCQLISLAAVCLPRVITATIGSDCIVGAAALREKLGRKKKVAIINFSDKLQLRTSGL